MVTLQECVCLVPFLCCSILPPDSQEAPCLLPAASLSQTDLSLSPYVQSRAANSVFGVQVKEIEEGPWGGQGYQNRWMESVEIRGEVGHFTDGQRERGRPFLLSSHVYDS